MIGHVVFDVLKGSTATPVLPYEEYGLLLVSYDAPPPKPRIFRVMIEGRNGSLDMTEWAGETFYDDRTITIVLRDMQRIYAQSFIGRMLSRRVKVCFDADNPDWYYIGRVDEITEKTRNNVTNITMRITCHPFKYPSFSDDDYAPGASGQAYSGRRTLTLSAATGVTGTATRTLHQDELSTPEIVIAGIDETENGTCTLTVNGTDYVIQTNGTMENPPDFRPGSNTVSLANSGYSSTITADIAYTDRVI